MVNKPFFEMSYNDLSDWWRELSHVQKSEWGAYCSKEEFDYLRLKRVENEVWNDDIFDSHEKYKDYWTKELATHIDETLDGK